MDRIRKRVVVVGIATLGVLLVATALTLMSSSPYPVEGRVVILDPGHFETPADTGALNLIGDTWLEERTVNWEVTLRTRSMLEEQGVIVVLTRQDGEFVSRPVRYRRADTSNGEVLISIHHNGTDDHRINYTTTFYTHQADISIARRAQNHLVDALEFPDSDIRRDTFGMTASTAMPSALTEAWFITNDELATRYLAEDVERVSRIPGAGWSEHSLVERESRALADAIINWLQSHPPPDRP